MKFSCVCAILLSTSIIQIFAKESDLEKATVSVIKSLVEVAEIPLNQLIVDIQPLKLDEIEKFVKQTLSRLRDLQRRLQKDYFDSLPPESKDTQKKIIGYVSYYVFALYSDSLRMAMTIANKSFDALPENVKKNVLDTSHEVHDFLKKIKVAHDESNVNVERR